MPTTEMNPAGAVPEEPVRPMVASKVHAATSWSKSTVYSPAEEMAVVELFTAGPAHYASAGVDDRPEARVAEDREVERLARQDSGHVVGADPDTCTTKSPSQQR